MTKYLITALISVLFSTATMANVDAVTQCLNDYTDRHAAMEAEGEALPPMRNLYPEWEEDCNNGGKINEELKKHSPTNTAATQEVEPMADFTATQVFVHVKQNPITLTWYSEFELTSTTNRAVAIKDIIINKGRCESLVTPGPLTASGNNATNLWKYDVQAKKWREYVMTLDYGQTLKAIPNSTKCPKILEVTVITDGGSLNYDFTQ